MHSEHKKTIVIVGAGIVGVTLAWYLSKESDSKIILLDKVCCSRGNTALFRMVKCFIWATRWL
ncbi:FAD-binding oxidoreductase [Providencia rettgeri]|nr:FAD-binding oxidoreductase [Providencia rettgeri]